jgi:hypothetical protein
MMVNYSGVHTSMPRVVPFTYKMLYASVILLATNVHGMVLTMVTGTVPAALNKALCW